MPRDAVSRTANVERTGRHKWVKEQVKKNINIKYVTVEKLFSKFADFYSEFFSVEIQNTQLFFFCLQF